MIVKKNIYRALLDEIDSKYGEYIEMGIPREHFALAMLYKEREKNWDLRSTIKQLEMSLYHATNRFNPKN